MTSIDYPISLYVRDGAEGPVYSDSGDETDCAYAEDSASVQYDYWLDDGEFCLSVKSFKNYEGFEFFDGMTVPFAQALFEAARDVLEADEDFRELAYNKVADEFRYTGPESDGSDGKLVEAQR